MHDAFAGDRRRQREQSKQRARSKLADFSLCLSSATRQHWFGTDNRPTMRDRISLSVSNKVVRSLIAGDSKPSGPVLGVGVQDAASTRAMALRASAEDIRVAPPVTDRLTKATQNKIQQLLRL
ncbi:MULTISPECIES: hypothetical protein [unclassified Bradyrhizobium]|uniref:hypothetical protein n=1 Tax=unclassified Bradyrhizobium TaxID=2631580 RepID=UPI003391BD95